ncbi:hypothetical protein PR048_013425 [Dryococelus australis]|uniref:DDE-1 domain-containing protein n=1 Tax=Dryococelus australis TaxID=614101 RepID=A0ABQ9HSF8_9NEOP|nr:hypothetical protein PR048_013425 [Dryococelus australis]
MAGLQVSEIVTILSGVVYVVKLKTLMHRLWANGNKYYHRSFRYTNPAMCSMVMKLDFFFRAIPTRTLIERKEKCVGGKKAKDRISVFIYGNIVGDFEKPSVVGKAANPRSFKGLGRYSLPVQWKFNKKSWMTAAIMEEWLHGFNLKT